MGPLLRLNLFGLIPIILSCSIAMRAAPASAGSAQPGTLNAITGEVSINGVPINLINGTPVTIESGRRIRTGQGMAEILLSPGSFLRLGTASELTLDTPDAREIKVQLQRGEALVEVLDAGAALTVEQNGVTAIVRNPGLYEFNQKRSLVAVYAGQAGLSKNDQQLVATAGLGIRTRRFLVFRTSPDPGNALLAWSRSRSEQLSRESRFSAQENSGARSRGPQWLWDPWSASYTFLSASGFVMGPFGWPYFSPGYAPDSIPVHRGDSWLYGPPVLSSPGPAQPLGPERGNVTPTVPLTAPGEPRFPSNR